MKLLCKIGFHKYKIKKDTTIYQYLECIFCKKRLIKIINLTGYQPIDREYLTER